MAQVFLALARGPAGFNKLAVIKQIREQLADDPEFLTMFLDEARLAARLNHPNVVQTNEVGEDGKRYFICMEYLEGQPLNRIIQRVGRENGIPMGLHLRILGEALAGLHHAHELTDYDGTPLEIVHRDVTPHNIFVTYAGQVKIVDFGIAKALSQSAETKAGVLKGKVAYMAPEQARGDKVDRRADIFSVGVIMWEALVGRRMFKGLTDVVIIQKIVNGQLQSPRSVNASIDEGLDAVCMKALAHNREDRYETAADFQSAIEQALEAMGDRSNLRDAGKLIQQNFEPERGRIKALVEAALGSQGGRMSGEFPMEGASTIHKFNLSGSDSGRLPIISDSPTHDGESGASRNPLMTSTARKADGTLTASAISPAPEQKSKLLVPLLVVGAIAAAAIGYVVFVKPAPKPADPAPVNAVATAPQRNKFSLKLESNPPGATIKENGKDIGTTPMAITLDGTSKDTRKFILSKEGYADYTYVQDPATEDTRFVATLPKAEAQPMASGSPSGDAAAKQGGSYPYRGGGGHSAPAVTSAAAAPPTPTAPPASTLDIKLNR